MEEKFLALIVFVAIALFLVARFIFLEIRRRKRIRKHLNDINKVFLWDVRKQCFCDPETGIAVDALLNIRPVPACVDDCIDKVNFLCKITDIFRIGEDLFAEVNLLPSKAKLKVRYIKNYCALVEINGVEHIFSTTRFSFPLKADEEREVLLNFNCLFKFEQLISKEILFWEVKKILLPNA